MTNSNVMKVTKELKCPNCGNDRDIEQLHFAMSFGLPERFLCNVCSKQFIKYKTN